MGLDLISIFGVGGGGIHTTFAYRGPFMEYRYWFERLRFFKHGATRLLALEEDLITPSLVA